MHATAHVAVRGEVGVEAGDGLGDLQQLVERVRELLRGLRRGPPSLDDQEVDDVAQLRLQAVAQERAQVCEGRRVEVPADHASGEHRIRPLAVVLERLHRVGAEDLSHEPADALRGLPLRDLLQQQLGLAAVLGEERLDDALPVGTDHRPVGGVARSVAHHAEQDPRALHLAQRREQAPHGIVADEVDALVLLEHREHRVPVRLRIDDRDHLEDVLQLVEGPVDADGPERRLVGEVVLGEGEVELAQEQPVIVIDQIEQRRQSVEPGVDAPDRLGVEPRVEPRELAPGLLDEQRRLDGLRALGQRLVRETFPAAASAPRSCRVPR